MRKISKAVIALITISLTWLVLSGCSMDNHKAHKMAGKNKTTEQARQSGATQKVVKLAENHWRTYTDIVIDAPAAKVWQVLTDWNHMPNWSSSLQGISGDIRDNGKVIALYTLNGKTNKIPHTLKYKEGEYFGWSDPMGGPFAGLTDNHTFEVKRLSDIQTLFIQTDEYKGEGNKANSAQSVAQQTVKNFPEFNQELKNEVEKSLR